MSANGAHFIVSRTCRVPRRKGLRTTDSAHERTSTLFGWGSSLPPSYRFAPHPATHLLLAPRYAGAPAKAIQELAGHPSLGTTLRYRHLSPAGRESAIRLLDGKGVGREIFGDIVETETSTATKAQK